MYIYFEPIVKNRHYKSEKKTFLFFFRVKNFTIANDNNLFLNLFKYQKEKIELRTSVLLQS